MQQVSKLQIFLRDSGEFLQFILQGSNQYDLRLQDLYIFMFTIIKL